MARPARASAHTGRRLPPRRRRTPGAAPRRARAGTSPGRGNRPRRRSGRAGRGAPGRTRSPRRHRPGVRAATSASHRPVSGRHRHAGILLSICGLPVRLTDEFLVLGRSTDRVLNAVVATGGGIDVEDRPAGRHPQGLLPARERRESPRLGAARAVLRGLADLPRDPRRRQRHDLRGRRERVARRERLAQPRSRRDVAAVERGPQLRRHRAQALEGVRPDRGRTAASSPAPRCPACSRAATAARPGRS